MELPDDTRAQVLGHGFAIVRNVLTLDEIAALRRTCQAFFEERPHMRSNLGRNLPDAVSYLSEIHWLYRHPNVIRAFRAALGCESIVFTRHCDIARNRLSGWHKDSGEPHPYFSGDFIGADDCNVYKMALYLQDHTTNRQGLWVKRGSHRIPNHEDGDVLHLATSVGDAVVFDVRLTHSGQFPDFLERRLKQASSLWCSLLSPGRDRKHDPELAVRLKDLYWRATGKGDKFSVFFTYGSPNAYTREFSEQNMARQDGQNLHAGPDRGPVDCTALFAALQAAGVPVFGVDS